MSEQQDKRQVREVLRTMGADHIDVGLWGIPYTGITVDLASPDEDATVVVIKTPASHAAALLQGTKANPITKERLETVVRGVLDGYETRAGDYEVGRMYGGLSAKCLADTIIARLFPEEAPTDAEPG